MKTKARPLLRILSAVVLITLLGAVPAPGADPDVTPPSSTVKLIFIHHSCGQNWLDDSSGQLGMELRDNNYFVSDTNYGWGPDSIGDSTDIGQWWTWFLGPSRNTYLSALFAESGKNSPYSRLATDPGGENAIIMFKSCYPNSNIRGNPDDAPTVGDNPLNGDSVGATLTVGNAKALYNDLLDYFTTRQDKLFIVITAPPLVSSSYGANARAFNDWLVNDWLDGYAHANVRVFDFYTVLTSNGGNSATNDLGSATGNHHRIRSGAVEHMKTVNNNLAAYSPDGSDSHPTAAGNQKGTQEFVPLLNSWYNVWAGTASATVNSTPALSLLLE